MYLSKASFKFLTYAGKFKFRGATSRADRLLRCRNSRSGIRIHFSGFLRRSAPIMKVQDEYVKPDNYFILIYALNKDLTCGNTSAKVAFDFGGGIKDASARRFRS